MSERSELTMGTACPPEAGLIRTPPEAVRR